MTQYIIYEDEKTSNFNPLVYFRPVYELRCGIFTLREKAEILFSEKFDLHSRKFLQNVLEEKFPERKINRFTGDEMIFLNGRAIFNDKTAKAIKDAPVNTAFINNGEVVAAKVTKKMFVELFSEFELLDFNIVREKLTNVEVQVKTLNYVWDAIYENGSEIISDASQFFNKRKNQNNLNYEGVWFLNRENIFIGENVKIYPTVVLDASDGAIVIDDDAVIMPQSVIQGPAYIGKKSIVKIGAKIYHETTIGEVSKVGGEVENSIVHSYSNKQHDGFLGHAYLGEWVNLGASTNNSDLKNNYGKISVKLNGKSVDTGLQFLGLIMGDHSKTAIGTLFNTGTIVGVSSNIFGAGFPPRAIPSFAWGGSDFIKEYKLEKAIEVAEIVMSRRKVELTASMRKLFEYVFESTKNERRSLRGK